VSDAAAAVRGALESRAHDLGALIGRSLVLGAAQNPETALAPSRPLVDPGRPLPFVREGGLDQLIATGFGFSADAVAKQAGQLGVAGALRATEVAVAPAHDPVGPVVEGPAVERLRTELRGRVDRLTADALKVNVVGGSGGLDTHVRAAEQPKLVRRRKPDALDALIEQAENGRGEDQ
jgi:hypothetical protein